MISDFEKLLNEYDNPQDKIKFIHIAGTNGKGSTCNMIAKILQKANYNVGLYISPHLVKINERIKVDFKDIEDEEFENIKNDVETKISINHYDINYFQLLTAIAFIYFYNKKCDIVVLECGLGGRLDPTNIIKTTIIAIITNIGMDHVEILGDTIEKIAFEKAGIIKENRPIIVYDLDKGIDIISDVAKKKNAKLVKADFNQINIIYYNNLEKIVFDYKNYKNIFLNLLGNHQVYNACVVLECVEVLKKEGYNISDDSVYQAFKEVENSARLQVIEKEPLVILDGGHNSQCINSLIQELPKDKKIVYVLTIFREKDANKMINLLSKVSKNFVVTYVNNERCLKKDEILCLFDESFNVTYEKNVEKAIEIAKDIAKNEGIVCITGSLYLCGEVLKIYDNIKLNKKF